MKTLFRITALTLALTRTHAIAAATQGVPHGTKAKALAYYTNLAAILEFRDPATITNSTLDDVPAYLGYGGIAASDLQAISPRILMDPAALGSAVTNSSLFHSNFDSNPLQAGDVLSSRFFAPKIIDINDPPATRALGWRKLIRLKAKPSSPANKHPIETAIILFNFLTGPRAKPFGSDAESGNTQVILTSTASDKDSIYWLDYGKLSQGGHLSFQLDQTFDARKLRTEQNPWRSVGRSTLLCAGRLRRLSRRRKPGKSPG